MSTSTPFVLWWPLWALLLSTSGCSVFFGPGHEHHQVMLNAPIGRVEAVNRGFRYCYEMGYVCRVRHAEIDEGKWVLNLNAVGRGKVYILLDAYTGEMLLAHENFEDYRHGEEPEEDEKGD